MTLFVIPALYYEVFLRKREAIIVKVQESPDDNKKEA
jgi:hypothetical protein